MQRFSATLMRVPMIRSLRNEALLILEGRGAVLEDRPRGQPHSRYRLSEARREFVKVGVPVHLISRSEVRNPRSGAIEIDRIQTVSLFDLINMKPASGTREPLRAIDLADVIGLIRHHKLTSRNAASVAQALRPEFRKLTKAISREAR